MQITQWFKGSSTCAGLIENTDGGPPGHCLATAVNFDWAALEHFARIIDRHFSHRATCWECLDGRWATTRVIHFNNCPETTKEDIDKVLRIYNEETERV